MLAGNYIGHFKREYEAKTLAGKQVIFDRPTSLSLSDDGKSNTLSLLKRQAAAAHMAIVCCLAGFHVYRCGDTGASIAR